MSYQQLTEGATIPVIGASRTGDVHPPTARAIGVHRSTLYRELRRNAGPQGYQPDNAHQHATHRRGQCGQISAICRCHPVVELTLAWWWSQEQMRGGQADKASW